MVAPKTNTGQVCLLAAAILVAVSTAQCQQQGTPTSPHPPTPSAPAPSPRVPLSAEANQIPATDGRDDQSPISFESHGLEYEALTKNGITVMFAPLPPQIKDFKVIQVTITNGSLVSWTIKPTDFTFVRQDGGTSNAVTADGVVASLLEKASRNDVIKLQLLYENSIYALSNYRPTNGYEKRREAAMAQFVNARFTAAAAASAIALAPLKLKPGDSTDGAIFFEYRVKERTLGPGRLVAHTCGEMFSFQVFAEPKLH